MAPMASRPVTNRCIRWVNSSGVITPKKRKYEIFAEGGGNAFGLEIDSTGPHFFRPQRRRHARVSLRARGLLSQRLFQARRRCPTRTPSATFEAMAQPQGAAVHAHVRHLRRGRPAREVSRQALRRRAATKPDRADRHCSATARRFKTEDINRPVTSDDKWFRPVDIKVGPDGAIYVADFYERYPSHREHYDGMVYNDRWPDLSPAGEGRQNEQASGHCAHVG